MQIRLITALLAAHASAVAFNCDHVRVDKTDFNLEKLGGPHSVVTTLRQPPSHSNTSYTVDICKPLKRKGDVPKGEECPSGTRGAFAWCSLAPAQLRLRYSCSHPVWG